MNNLVLFLRKTSVTILTVPFFRKIPLFKLSLGHTRLVLNQTSHTRQRTVIRVASILLYEIKTMKLVTFFTIVLLTVVASKRMYSLNSGFNLCRMYFPNTFVQSLFHSSKS